jgi:signal transduction histidine kinase
VKQLLHFAMLCLLALPLAGAPLDSVREVLSLTPEQAAEKRPVSFEATLLVDDRQRSTFFVHHGDASCYASIPTALQGEVLKQGLRYRIGGITTAGDYQPGIEVTSLIPLGPGMEPEPLRLADDHIFSTYADAQWVEIEGRVEGSSFREGGPSMDISVQGWIIHAFLPRDASPDAILPWHLLGQKVRIRGIAAGTFNDERQMTRRFVFVPSLQHVAPVGEIVTATVRPATASSLLGLGSELNTRVRVRGVVTHRVEGESVYLRDESATLRILTAQPLPLNPGDVIEAEGLAALELIRPALRATELRKISDGPAPQPVIFDAEEKLNSRLHHELIRTTADLLTMREGADGFVLQCRSGTKVIEASLDKRLAKSLPETIIPGCRLQLTGLLELRPSRFFSRLDWIDGFRVHLRSANDITILARPPWWTIGRLLALVGGLVLLAGTVSTWAFLLRRQVAEQTETIRSKLTRETVLEERQRIARDWHDTMEQQLMGVSMIVEDATARLTEDTDVGHRLHLAERMLRHCREESRSTIRDLRSVALEAGGLVAAFAEFLPPLAQSGGAEFSLENKGIQRRLPIRTEQALLRIAQEAVANAVHHSSANHIRVMLDDTGTIVRLEVKDDGIGFAAEEMPTEGTHLGIAGMRERARRMEATFQIITQKGAGTRVIVTVEISSLS